MIELNKDKCVKCFLCSYVCPHGVIEMNGGEAELTYAERCVSCGACQLNCPSGAICVTKKTGCVITIIKEDILKIKGESAECQDNNCAQKNSHEKSIKKVLLFAPQGFEDIEVAAFTDVLGWTRVLKEVEPVEVVITAFKRYVNSKHGLIIKAHKLLDEVNARDYSALIIPGGFNDSGYTEAYDEKVLSLIKEIYTGCGIIAAMCVGSLPIAKSGILKGKEATTYSASKRHDNLQILRDYGAVPVDRRIVVSGRIITNRGPDTTFETAFKLLELLNGEADMKKVRKALMFE